eukprot:CAMPEP_0194479956 /NCGR_PEP_ID=MMETSP0253-20130528/2918_1 /TAXON_ID=2966 /ORGANISM="Noctiluca scintillans" /LENGTH=113 /DNA_ID=CAMNT_0039319265 /DNA_START=64 /DNA_END=405 /DNA_ORIENTATION=+
MKAICYVILAVVCSATVLKHEPLLPIGVGAYQSGEAVKQRTTDTRVACEEGRWEDCMHKNAGDLVDGHSYGNLRATEHEHEHTAKAKSGATTAACGAMWLTVVSLMVHWVMLY